MSDEWYTPKHVFDAMDVWFDLDVSAPIEGPRYVPCSGFISDNSLQRSWDGFVWMNPPFGGRNGLVPWLDKFFAHGDGVALTPDRTSAPWWQDAATRAAMLLLTRGKIKFERPDGTTGNSPGAGVTLFAAGERGARALIAAQKAGLGSTWRRAE
jgi:hypothetical protein